METKRTIGASYGRKVDMKRLGGKQYENVDIAFWDSKEIPAETPEEEVKELHIKLFEEQKTLVEQEIIKLYERLNPKNES